jgi:hypothetical protein
VQFEEAPGQLILTVSGSPPERRYTVRLPGRFVVGNNETTIEIPPGVTRFEIPHPERP